MKHKKDERDEAYYAYVYFVGGETNEIRNEYLYEVIDNCIKRHISFSTNLPLNREKPKFDVIRLDELQSLDVTEEILYYDDVDIENGHIILKKDETGERYDQSFEEIADAIAREGDTLILSYDFTSDDKYEREFDEFIKLYSKYFTRIWVATGANCLYDYFSSNRSFHYWISLDIDDKLEVEIISADEFRDRERKTNGWYTK